MSKEAIAGGVSAPVSWSGKTYRELLAPTEAQTLAQFYKKRSGSSSRKHPMCLCLTVDGQWQDACSGQTAAGLSRGGYLMRSFGESPNVAVASRSSQILEANAPQKYYLSAKACLGIIRRAERRGKELPPTLREALMAQSKAVSDANPWDSQTIRQYAVDGVSPCLSSNATGGQNRAGICAPVAYAQQSFGDCKPSDVAGTQCGRWAKDATDLVCYPETARSLLARHDGSPCLDRGPNVVFQSAPIAFSNRGQTGGETAETLRAESHGALPMVCAAGFKGGQSEKARSIGFVDEQAPTLSANGSHLDPTVFCIQGNCIDRADTAGCNGKGWKAEQSYTLNTVDRPAVVYDARGNGKGEIAPTQTGDHQSRVTDYTALVVSDVAAVDCRNGTENTGVNGTLQAKSNGGQSLNLHLPDALECVKAWGFQYVTLITWCKDSMGLGQYFRGMTEHCIFATTQKKLPYKLEEGKRMQGVTGFVEPKREHSRKPETMRKMIERVSYTPRIELFARRAAPGWKVWGNEAPEEQEAAT